MEAMEFDLPALLNQSAPLWLPLVVGILTREIFQLGAWVIGKLSSNLKTAPLAQAVPVLEDVFTAGLKVAAANYQKGSAEATLAALEAAKQTVLGQQGQLFKAGKDELVALTTKVATPVSAPGGATVTLPSPITVKIS